MARKLGQHYRLAVSDAASPEVFTVIAGQTGLSRDGSSNLIDQSSKTTGKYAVQSPGRAQLTLTVTGNVEVPDANGLEAVKALDASDPVPARNFQIQDHSVSPATVIFTCSMYVSNFSTDSPDQDNATYSFTLTAAAQPTVDDLTP